MIELNEEDHNQPPIKGFILDWKERSKSNPNGKRKSIEIVFYNRRKADKTIKPYGCTVKVAGQYFQHEGVQTLGALFTDYFSNRYYPSDKMLQDLKHINLPDRYEKSYIMTRTQAARDYDEVGIDATEAETLRDTVVRLEREVARLTHSLNNQVPETVPTLPSAATASKKPVQDKLTSNNKKQQGGKNS